MKKTKIKLSISFFVLATFIAFIGCEKNDVATSSPNVINSDFAQTQQTQARVTLDSINEITEIFFRAGISKLYLEISENDTIINVSNEITVNDSIIQLSNKLYDDQFTDLREYSLKLSEGSLSIVGEEGLSMEVHDNKPYIISASYTGFLEDNTELLQNKMFLYFYST